ncbi:MAG: hypothetical protein KF713_10850 [Turneriella sp.]|nr:hypothetical protein [Turneriella sp.]
MAQVKLHAAAIADITSRHRFAKQQIAEGIELRALICADIFCQRSVSCFGKRHRRKTGRAHPP